MIQIELNAVILLRHLDRILNHSQGAKSQEVHLQKAQLLQCRHRKLGGDGTVRRSGQRHILVHCLLADHDACRMHGRVARQSLKALSHINQIVNLIVLLIRLSELRVHLQRLVDRDVELCGNHLRDRIHSRVGHVQHSSHIADYSSSRQRTERYDLYDPVLSVLAHHVVDDFLPPFEAEVNINIRHGHTLRVQEALKEQIIPDWIQLRDSQRV